MLCVSSSSADRDASSAASSAAGGSAADSKSDPRVTSESAGGVRDCAEALKSERVAGFSGSVGDTVQEGDICMVNLNEAGGADARWFVCRVDYADVDITKYDDPDVELTNGRARF